LKRFLELIEKGSETMYRPRIKVVDCTIRDGGLVNNSYFDLETVRTVYRTACDAGIDYVELGYRNSDKLFSRDKFGPWRFCDEKDLRAATDGIEKKDTKIAIMQDAHKAFGEDILPKEQSVVDMIRVATYVKDVDKAIKLANNATEKGYEATINIMSISQTIEWELDEALQQLGNETQAAAIYVVDSFGALYSEDFDYYIQKYRKYIGNKEVGVHCHNSKQLAFANTIEGIIKNANYLDATICGIGRASGNCPLELLLGFLKNPKFDIRPILDVISSHVEPLRSQITWGSEVIPFMIAGILNMHPEEAMKLMALPKDDPKRRDYRAFYEKTLEEIEP
jgi:4-hydroxy 2-oxovalerate aldolase